MLRIPAVARAKLEAQGFDVDALEQMAAQYPPGLRRVLLNVMGTDHVGWGIDRPERGTEMSRLMDWAFANVEGYKKINE